MKSIKSWLPFIFWQALMAGGLYAWKAHELEAGRNVVLFVAWMMAVFGMAGAFVTPNKPMIPRGPTRRAAGRTASLGWLLIFAALGYFGLAVAYVLGATGNEVYLDKFDADGKPLPDTNPDNEFL